MEKIFPEKKTKLKIKTLGLPNVKKLSKETFSFEIFRDGKNFILIISHTAKGYDLCIADSKEQESWLREIEKTFAKGFRESWYCRWEIKNEKTLNKFLEIIESNIIEKKYS